MAGTVSPTVELDGLLELFSGHSAQPSQLNISTPRDQSLTRVTRIYLLWSCKLNCPNCAKVKDGYLVALSVSQPDFCTYGMATRQLGLDPLSRGEGGLIMKFSTIRGTYGGESIPLFKKSRPDSLSYWVRINGNIHFEQGTEPLDSSGPYLFLSLPIPIDSVV
ncbi:unnamed protein product [Protopolystoma xenopodis]|uniref:Uncharacterized protein n=1 Tax=Protopolystoma xenopodis TaxID=117903 RepID=A0A3S5B4G2_9PLAT|nr:unnamed protein product [Protopolystoma xenopodis]